MHFAPEVQQQFRVLESRMIEALAEMFEAGSSGGDPDEDARDRARVIIASSSFLAKMVFDGVSEERRNAFVQHIPEPLTR